MKAGRSSSVGCASACLGLSRIRSSRSATSLSWRFCHEIISTAILSLPLIPIGQLSVTGERMCTKYWLTSYRSLLRNSVVRLTDRLDMTIVVEWDVKPQINQPTNILKRFLPLKNYEMDFRFSGNNEIIECACI